jgi:heme exporter protein CcmD
MAILCAPCAGELDLDQTPLKYDETPAMNWGSVSASLAMGGYAGFVGGSYGVTALCNAFEVTLLIARQRRLRREITHGQTSPRSF